MQKKSVVSAVTLLGGNLFLAIMERGDKVNYFDIYKAVWEFHKKYSKVRDSPEYWEQVDKESREILEGYHNEGFVRGLLVAVVMELERVGKGLK